MPSVFAPKGRNSSHRKGKSSKHSNSPRTPSVAPGALLYTGINEVTAWLRVMQQGLDGTFAGAPEPLRLHVKNAMLSLHEMVEVMTDKLPKADAIKPEVLEHKEVKATLDAIEASLGTAAPTATPVSNDAKRKAGKKLIAHGILEGLRLLAYRKTPEAQLWVGIHGTTKAAALRLFDLWEEERENVCELNRHDAEEYRELRIAMQEDAHKAHQYINSIA